MNKPEKWNARSALTGRCRILLALAFAACGAARAIAAAGSVDGVGPEARFRQPCGIAIDSHGEIYVADTGNHLVRRVSTSGAVSTLAGMAGKGGSADANGVDARFDLPRALALGKEGNVFVADTNNNSIRHITPLLEVSTIAGSAAETMGSADGPGAQARFDAPRGIAIDSAGNLYVADSGNDEIRRITPAGIVTTLAGSAGIFGNVDAPGADAQFHGPVGIALDAARNIYVADTDNSTIRKISPSGMVSTLAGKAGANGSADGTGILAQFNNPRGIALDRSGNLYVADTGNNTIRRVAPGGIVTTLAGMAGVAGSADGDGTSASFDGPCGIAVAPGGELYVADANNDTIRRISIGGTVTTVAGKAREDEDDKDEK